MGLKFSKLEKPVTVQGIKFTDVYVYNDILIHMADATVSSMVVNNSSLCFKASECAQLFALREVAQNFIDTRIEMNVQQYMKSRGINKLSETDYPHIAKMFASSYKEVKIQQIGNDKDKYMYFSSPGTIGEDIFVWGYSGKNDVDYGPFRLIGHFGVGLKETILVMLYQMYNYPLSMVMSFGGHVYTLAYNYNDKLVLSFDDEFNNTSDFRALLRKVEGSNPVILRGDLPATFKGVNLVDGQINFFVKMISQLPVNVIYPHEHNVARKVDANSYIYHNGLLAGRSDLSFDLNTTRVNTDQYRTYAVLTNDYHHPISSTDAENNITALYYTLTEQDVELMAKIIADDMEVVNDISRDVHNFFINTPNFLDDLLDYMHTHDGGRKYQVFFDAFLEHLSTFVSSLPPALYIFDTSWEYDDNSKVLTRSGIYLGSQRAGKSVYKIVPSTFVEQMIDALNQRFGSKGYQFMTVKNFLSQTEKERILGKAMPLFSDEVPTPIKAGVKLGEYLLSYATFLYNKAEDYAMNPNYACYFEKFVNQINGCHDVPYVYCSPIPEDRIYIFKDDSVEFERTVLGVTYRFRSDTERIPYIILASEDVLADDVGGPDNISGMIFLTSSLFLHESIHYSTETEHGTTGFEYLFYLLSQSIGIASPLVDPTLYVVHNVMSMAYTDPEMFLKAKDFHEISSFFVDDRIFAEKTCDAVIIGSVLQCVDKFVNALPGLSDLKGSPITLTVEYGKVKIKGIEKVERLPLYIE